MRIGPREEPVPADLAPADLVSSIPFVLADVHFHPLSRTLTGPSGSVRVEPRIMQLLVVLADAKGEVLPKEVLLQRCWDGMVVGEDSLHRAAAGARRALREAGATALAIETIPKIGYRMQASKPASHPLAEPAMADSPSVASRRRVITAAVAGAGAVAGLSALGWSAIRTRRDPRVDALIERSEQALRLAEPVPERQGVEFLKQAVKLAPKDPLPWGRLALALRLTAEFAAPAQVAGLLAQAEAAAGRALALQPGQIDARAALALMIPSFGNWHEAETRLQEVLADAPDHLPTLDGLSFVQASAGLVSLHYPLRLKTVKLDPLHAGYNFRSIYAHWMNGDLAAADRAGARGLELWPGNLATWLARAGLFALTGRPERTLAMLDDPGPRPDLPPPLVDLLRVGAEALADGGEAARLAAADWLDKAVTGSGPLLAVNASTFLCALREPRRALDIVEAFLLERGPVMAATAWQPGQALHNDIRRRFTNFLFTPVMAPVRAEARFEHIMRDIGLSDYWRRSSKRPDYLGREPLP